jgi:thioesterase domain-containing protein
MQELRALRSFEKRYGKVTGREALDQGDFEFQDLLNYAASHYQPAAPLAWPVLLVRAGERVDDRATDEDWGWRSCAPRLDVQWAEGDHGTIFEEPHVTGSARLIRSWLDGLAEIS